MNLVKLKFSIWHMKFSRQENNPCISAILACTYEILLYYHFVSCKVSPVSNDLSFVSTEHL